MKVSHDDYDLISNYCALCLVKGKQNMLQLKISIITSVTKILVGQGDGMNTSPGIRMFSSQLSYSLNKMKLLKDVAFVSLFA